MGKGKVCCEIKRAAVKIVDEKIDASFKFASYPRPGHTLS